MLILFWLLLAIIFYTYIGYGMLLFFIILIKRIFTGKPRPVAIPADVDLPTVSFVVAAFNEEYILQEKIMNTLELDYAPGKMQMIVITDGSSDDSYAIAKSFASVKALHQPERRGKLAAMERAIEHCKGEILIFSDANTLLNNEAIVRICSHYADSKTGAVAGEKKVLTPGQTDAAASEGMYWKYESQLKKWDSELYSVVGAAGELFSVRKSLYVPVPKDTVLDDFMISLRIAEKGYRVVYEPGAYATEFSSENVQEEFKRKVRIAAGGIQSILRLPKLLLPVPYPVLSFQYISHRVLRWTLTPFSMILLFLLNILLVVMHPVLNIYAVILALQVAFYGMALAGWYLESRHMKSRIFFIPYYFCMMNVAVVAGIFRYFSGAQSVKWEKSKRRVA